MAHRTKTWVLALALGTGCGEDDSVSGAEDITDEMPEDLPAGQCGTSTGAENCETEGDPSTSTGDADASSSSSSTGEPGDACLSSEECSGNDVCAAQWNAVEQTRGLYACQFACITTLDDNKVCADDAACCDAGAFCTERGYCVVEDSGSSSGGTSTGADTE